MAKFYDEFYRQKGTKHDDLVIKCVTDDEIARKIIETAPPNAPKYKYFAPSCDGIHYFPPGSPVGEWRKDTYEKWNSKKGAYETLGKRECTNTKCDLHPDMSGGCPWAESGDKGKYLECYVYKPIGDVEYTYNTEIVCKNGSFIVGYADILFNLKWNLLPIIGIEIPQIELERYEEIDSDWSKWFLNYAENAWPEKNSLGYNGVGLSHLVSQNYAAGNYTESVLVEAKPDLNDVGSIIRQLKTYYDLLSRGRDIRKIVVVTYTNVDKKYISLLENEGIECIVVEE